MAVCGRIGVRAFVTAVVLLLGVLLGAESASAHVAADVVRPATAPLSYAASSPEHSGSSEDDSKQRHGPRRQAGLRAPAGLPECGCAGRARAAQSCGVAVTVRDSAPRGPTVELPLLYQTFRC